MAHPDARVTHACVTFWTTPATLVGAARGGGELRFSPIHLCPGGELGSRFHGLEFTSNFAVSRYDETMCFRTEGEGQKKEEKEV